MRRVFVALWFALLCHAEEGYTIAGHVVRHLDQRPVAGVHVSIDMLKDPNRHASAVTGENGEFSFQGVPAGKYRLGVVEHGVTRLYRQFDDYSTAIVAGPKLDTLHILFPLDSPASITGTVLDDDNEPVSQLTVCLFHRAMTLGRYETGVQFGQTTDASGHFHFRGLEPGTYYVAVTGRPWYAQNFEQPNPNPELDLAYPMTYYGGATSAEEATPLNLVEGQKAELQINLHAVAALHIKLEGMAAEPGSPQRAIMLAQGGPGGTAVNLPVSVINSEMMGIAPGRYSLTYGSEMQTVLLTGNTELQIGRGTKTSIKGKVALDRANSPGQLDISLGNDKGTGFQSVAVQPDGSFEFPNIVAGKYSLVLGGATDTYFSKVEAKGANYLDGILDVATGAHIELMITLGHGLANVDGLVLQEKLPLAGAMVLLVPQNRKSGNIIGRDQSDADGTFSILNVAPGLYTLVAIDDGRGLAYADPAILAPYLQHGQVIDVPPRKAINIEVQHRLQ